MVVVDDAFWQLMPRDALAAAAVAAVAAAGKDSPCLEAAGIPSAPWGQSPCASTCCGCSRPVWYIEGV